MFATTTPKSSPVLWQGETQDGYTLRLSRSGLAKIASSLKQSGLYHLVHNSMNGSLEAAIVRAIAQVVSNATHSNSGQRTQVFRAVGKTRNYQILTQSLNPQQNVILSIRARPKESSRNLEDYSFSLPELEINFEYFQAPEGRRKQLKTRKARKTRDRMAGIQRAPRAPQPKIPKPRKPRSAEAKARREQEVNNRFRRKVKTDFKWDPSMIPPQVLRKVNEISDMRMDPDNSNGAIFPDQSVYPYWHAGTYRIFGKFDQDIFNFIGYGTHQGKTNNKYTVTLPNQKKQVTARNK